MLKVYLVAEEREAMFEFLRKPALDINQGIQEWKNIPNAILLDVRETEEYADGHIPHAKNVPLSRIKTIENEIADKHSPIFVYCHSGARSERAVKYMKAHGYTNIKNIGGISTYSGEKNL